MPVEGIESPKAGAPDFISFLLYNQIAMPIILEELLDWDHRSDRAETIATAIRDRLSQCRTMNPSENMDCPKGHS